MNKQLKLILNKDGSGIDLNSLFPSTYSPEFELDTSNLDDVFSQSRALNTISIGSDYCRELVSEDTKSDYVILSDYHSSEFKTSNVVYGFDKIYWMGRDGGLNPLQWISEGSVNDYVDPYIKYRYVERFTITEDKIPLIPDQWGNILELGIEYYIGNTKMHVTTSIQIVKDKVFTHLISGFEGVNVIGPIQWKSSPSSETVYDLHYNNDSSQSITDDNYILYSYFGKSDVNNLFELVISDKNIFVYSVNDSITKYKVIYCKVYKPINWNQDE